jgi:hypothetical protein
VAAALLLTAGGFLSLAMETSAPAWLGIGAAALVLLHKWNTRPLVRLTDDQVARYRLAEGGGIAVVLAVLFT